MKYIFFCLIAFWLAPISILAQTSFVESSLQKGLNFEYQESLKMGGGAASFDYDKDGDEDIFVVVGQNTDALFENDGNGNFTNVSLETGIRDLTEGYMSTSVVTGDIDNDGYREIFIGTIGDPDSGFNSMKENILLKFDPSTSQYSNIIHSSLILWAMNAL